MKHRMQKCWIGEVPEVKHGIGSCTLVIDKETEI